MLSILLISNILNSLVLQKLTQRVYFRPLLATNSPSAGNESLPNVVKLCLGQQCYASKVSIVLMGH